MIDQKKLVSWVTAWPEWYEIFGNVEVVPLSDYVELRAENERLNGGMAAMQEGLLRATQCELAARQEAEHLAAKLVEVQKDAARYRWLRREAEWHSNGDQPTVWIVIGTGADDAVPASGDDADRIIDAALAQSQPQAGGGEQP